MLDTDAGSDTDQTRTHKPTSRGFLISNWVNLLILGGIVVLVLMPLFAGRVLYWGDILLYFDPMSRFAKDQLLHDRIPLWNPWILCGQPFVGNPQMSVFYPSTLLLLFLPVPYALSVNTVVHLWLCGAGMYWFLSRWTMRPISALLGAVVFMCSSCVLGRLQFTPMIQALAYLPLLLGLIDRAIDRPHPIWYLRMAGVLTLSILAAHTQITYMNLLTGSAYCLVRLICRLPLFAGCIPGDTKRTATARRVGRRTLGSLVFRLYPFVAAVIAALALCSIYLLPAFQLLHESVRQQMSPGEANRFFADFPHLLTVVFPRFVGHPATRDFWARGNAWEPAWFVGWIPLMVTCYAVAIRHNTMCVRFWCVIGILGVWMATGLAGGLYWICFYLVPGLHNFHDPARFLLWPTLSLSVLSAVGVDLILIRVPRRRNAWQYVLFFGIVVPLLWYGKDWNPTAPLDDLEHAVPAVRGVGITTRLDRISNAAAPRVWKRVVGDGYIDYGANTVSSLRVGSRGMLSNLEMRAHVLSASGYEPVPVGGHVALEGLSRIALQRRDPMSGALLGLCGVGILATDRTRGATLPRFETNDPFKQFGSLRFRSNRDNYGPAWVARNYKPVDGNMRIASAIDDPGGEDDAEVTLASGEAPSKSPAAFGSELFPTGGGGGFQSVRCLVLSDTRTQIEVEAGRSGGLLVSSGTAYPGWKAKINKQRVPIQRVNGCLMGIPVPAGSHQIQLTYESDMYRVGAFATLLATSMLAGTLSYGRMVGKASFIRLGAGKEISDGDK